MSVCHGFVQNTWRKDHCTNCFRMREEHDDIGNSVTLNNAGTGRNGISNNHNNGVNNSTTTNNNHNHHHGHHPHNHKIPGSEMSSESSVSQRVNRFSSSTTSLSSSGSSSSIPRVNSGTAINQVGKVSGPNNHNSSSTSTPQQSSSSSSSAKGHHQSIHSALNGSRNNLNGNANHNHESNEPNLPETLFGRVKCSSTEAIQQHLQKSSCPSLSTTKQIQHQLQLQQQGKGVMMTNSHPSKSDNASVIPPPNHHNHHKLAMTSSAPPVAPAAAATIQHQQQTTTTGRSVSAFIASKNIFNNATTSSSSSSMSGGGSGSITTTASSSSGSTTVITTPLLLPPSATGSTGNVVNGTVVTVASNTSSAAAASSSCLSHSPQLANSIKRGNITVLSSSSSSASSSTFTIQQNLIKNSSYSNNSSASASSSGFVDFSKNLENHAKNGLIEKWEFSSDSNNCSSNNGNGGGTLSSGKVAIKVISQQASPSSAAEMNNINIDMKGNSKVLRFTDGGGGGSGTSTSSDVENLDRRKEKYSPSASSNSVYVGGGDSMVKLAKSKGILRSKSGAKRREKNVRFPEKVVEVIGYGGGPSGLSDDEDDGPSDPMESPSVTEIMEKNATTPEEKELHRLTQKNTNFNSIKTNLLGTTCIEIGPIVGCTGGKSMEGSSKPLVSIGTFETRKEPLRIQKKISEDSADDELNEKTVEKHRKFIPRSSVGATSTTGKASSSTSTQQPSKIATMVGSSNSSSTAINKEPTEAKQHTTVTTLSQKSHTKNTTSSAFNSSSVTTNKASISSSSSTSSSKTSSSISNKNASSSSSSSFFDSSRGNGSSTGSATTTIEVNPEQSSSVSGVLRGSIESVTSNRINSSSLTTTTISSSSSSSTSKWSGASNANNNDGNSSSRNKPVLKRIQQQKSMSETSSSSSSGEGFETNNRFSTVNGASTMNTRNNTNSNLIILTNGEKNAKGSSVVVGNNNGSSIASKRNSFLRDIIVDSSSTTMEGSAGGCEINQSSTSASSSGGVQVICKNSSGNDPRTDSMKSELKVDLKPSVHNGKLSHPPFGECLSNRSNGTDDSSEFDDSLEDSGLDIKKCSEISESDEKSGSGSDSGNENDYSDRDRMKIISGNGPKSGLFISVDEVEGQNKKPEKLSPDSVLFSSASEMSASGSSESIPEALDTVSNGSSQKNSASSSSLSGNESGSSNSASPNSASTKRAAPKPPTTAPPDIPNGSHAIYANSSSASKTNASVVEVESLYDDVSFYKNPMHFPPTKDCKLSVFEEVEKEDESIYDDCTTLTAANGKGIKPNGGKSAVGSYNFQNASHNVVDSDGEEETEKVVTRRSDGIEFIGIRKIDSESFLRERSPTPDRSNPDAKRERSSSASPKTRRKVNQFFSTIGKKAGAAFSQHVHGYSSKNKSSPVIEDAGVNTSPSGKGSSAYKRSLSTDEVSMTRTQEIYATLTPTSLKFKGLGPVLHKLSKIDLNLGDKDKGDVDDDRLDSKDKGFKKHKISSSIKKFLRFGSKDGDSNGGNKYDFGHSSSSHIKTDSSQMITSQISEEGVSTESGPSRSPTPTMSGVSTRPLQKLPERKPSYGTISGRPPPPPPPRVHSLDLLNRVGVAGPNGTVRPARPPPPTRNNRVAPSFTAVFNNPNGDVEGKTSGTNEGQTSSQNTSSNGGDSNLPDPNNPPCKPKRKASMNLDCVTNGISRDLETTYNHITTLNLETLKLIAGQTPTKIRRNSSINKRNVPLRWSNFHIPETKPLIQGLGFVFYSASLGDESCVLLVQETATAPNFSAPFEFTCVETAATFEDCIPDSFITWKASEYVTSGSNVRVFVSVMPNCSMYSVEGYMRHSQVPLLHKYFALLQAMTFWDKEEMTDLLVLVQSMEESSDSHFLSSPVSRAEAPSSSSPASVLVYVHPVPHLKSGGKRSSSKTQIYMEFENAMKQILLNNGSDGTTPLLGDNDRSVLLKRITENKTKTVQDQIRLFLQVKLFAPKRDSDELERIKKLRSERAIQQWLDRERALCMKEAVEQTLQRNVESSISPYKRSYLEFLLTPENSAKAVLEMLIDLLE